MPQTHAAENTAVASPSSNGQKHTTAPCASSLPLAFALAVQTPASFAHVELMALTIVMCVFRIVLAFPRTEVAREHSTESSVNALLCSALPPLSELPRMGLLIF